MRKPLIVIDPGHGGRDSGACYSGLREKNIVLAISLFLGGFLQPDYNCVFTRTSDIYIPLKDRVFIANNYNASIFISIHTNASKSHKARGEELWIYPGSRKGMKLAKAIATYIDDIVPGRFRGIKENTFYVLRYTKVPALLIEVGFLDTPETPLADTGTQLKAAFQISKGIRKYFAGRKKC